MNQGEKKKTQLKMGKIYEQGKLKWKNIFVMSFKTYVKGNKNVFYKLLHSPTLRKNK